MQFIFCVTFLDNKILGAEFANLIFIFWNLWQAYVWRVYVARTYVHAHICVRAVLVVDTQLSPLIIAYRVNMTTTWLSSVTLTHHYVPPKQNARMSNQRWINPGTESQVLAGIELTLVWHSVSVFEWSLSVSPPRHSIIECQWGGGN